LINVEKKEEKQLVWLGLIGIYWNVSVLKMIGSLLFGCSVKYLATGKLECHLPLRTTVAAELK